MKFPCSSYIFDQTTDFGNLTNFFFFFFLDVMPGLSFSENKCSTETLIQTPKEQLAVLLTTLLTATAG